MCGDVDGVFGGLVEGFENAHDGEAYSTLDAGRSFSLSDAEAKSL